MIRIKVIRATHLAIGLAVAALVIAAALILLGLASRREAPVDRLQASMVPGGGGDISAAASVRLGGSPALEETHIPARTARPAVSDAPAFGGPAPAGKRILIYHTHTHEAYAQEAEDAYKEVAAWRTEDGGHSVVRVGKALAELLADMGYQVTHDTADYEQNDIARAYERSLETLLTYTETFDLYIDLHRDAFSGGNEDARALTRDGVTYARVMFLVGRGEGFGNQSEDTAGTVGGECMPTYRENLAFARAVTGAMSRILPGSTRPVMTTAQRYNQHIGFPVALIEVGHNQNTLAEALAVLPALAQALDEVLRVS